MHGCWDLGDAKDRGNMIYMSLFWQKIISNLPVWVKFALKCACSWVCNVVGKGEWGVFFFWRKWKLLICVCWGCQQWNRDKSLVGGWVLCVFYFGDKATYLFEKLNEFCRVMLWLKLSLELKVYYNLKVTPNILCEYRVSSSLEVDLEETRKMTRYLNCFIMLEKFIWEFCANDDNSTISNQLILWGSYFCHCAWHVNSCHMLGIIWVYVSFQTG